MYIPPREGGGGGVSEGIWKITGQYTGKLDCPKVYCCLLFIVVFQLLTFINK